MPGLLAFVAYAIDAAVDIAATARGDDATRAVSKPLLMPLLSLAFLLFSRGVPAGVRRWLLGDLLFSCAGDTALLQRDAVAFACGSLWFALAHGCAIVALVSLTGCGKTPGTVSTPAVPPETSSLVAQSTLCFFAPRSSLRRNIRGRSGHRGSFRNLLGDRRAGFVQKRPWIVALVALAWLVPNAVLWPHLGLAATVVLPYSAILLIMATYAVDTIGRVPAPAALALVAGALLFVQSDSTIAFSRFDPALAPPGAPVLIIALYIGAQAAIALGVVLANARSFATRDDGRTATANTAARTTVANP